MSNSNTKKLPDDIEFIQAVFVDMYSRGLGKMFPRSKYEDILNNDNEVVSVLDLFGPNFELPMFNKKLSEAGFPNKIMIFDSKTVFQCPWSPTVAMCLYDLHSLSNNPCPMNPRLLAKNCIDKLKSEFNLEFMMGVENEFYLFHKNSKEPIYNYHQMFDSRFQSIDMLPYMTLLKKYLDVFNIDMDSWNNEYGSGQLEIPLAPAKGLKACDNTWLLQHCAKIAASKLDMIASFMTSPIPNNMSSGRHINHSLWQGNKNVFHSAEVLSELGQHWLAGLLHHSEALGAFFYPTVNCYRRVHSAAWSPVQLTWNYQDRMCAMRVRTNKSNQKGTFIENRLPTSAANIYLAVSAMIIAGMDGIRNKMKLQPPGNNGSTGSVRRSLQESLNKLQKDEVLVKGLGKEFIKEYVDCKTHYEVETFKDVNMSVSTAESFAQEINTYLNL